MTRKGHHSRLTGPRLLYAKLEKQNMYCNLRDANGEKERRNYPEFKFFMKEWGGKMGKDQYDPIDNFKNDPSKKNKKNRKK